MTLSSENNQQKIKTSSAASTLPEEDYNEVIQDIWREMNKNSEPAPVEQLSFPAYKPPATSTAINGNTVIPASHATASHATAPHATVSHATVSHATTPALPTLGTQIIILCYMFVKAYRNSHILLPSLKICFLLTSLEF